MQFWFLQLKDKVEVQKVQKKPTKTMKERDKVLYVERLKMLKLVPRIESAETMNERKQGTRHRRRKGKGSRFG